MGFCIISDMVPGDWIGIFIIDNIGNVKIGSALDARRDGGGFLVGIVLERVAVWTLRCCIP